MRLMKNLHLVTKLVMGALGTAILILVVGTIGYYATNKLQDNTTEIIRTVSTIDASVKIKESFIKVYQRLGRFDHVHSMEELKPIKEAYLVGIEALNVYTDAIKNGGMTKQGRIWPTHDDYALEVLAELRRVYDEEFKPDALKVLTLREESLQKPDDKELFTKFDEALDEFESRSKDMEDMSVDLEDLLKSHIDEVVSNSGEVYENMTRLILLVASIGFIVCIVAGIYFARSISNPIIVLANELQASSNTLSTTAEEILAISNDLSDASQKQAQSLEETSASLEEMTSMVNNNVEGAQVTVDVAEQIKRRADRGTASMQELQKSISEILKSNENIQGLVNVINQIGKKTQVIDEIVFQTKLLSFNASVEAERAGEHGRGFAVVAQEVGNLAQMSGKAAKEIGDIVKDSVKKADEIANDNKLKVEAGAKIVAETSKVLGEIEHSASQGAQNANQIHRSSSEQADGIKQINNAVQELDTVTQENNETAYKVATSNEDLTRQIGMLQGIINRLNAVVSGDKTGALDQVGDDLVQNDPEVFEDK